MGQVVADRVKETSTTTGTGAFTVLGATVGHRALSAVLTVGDTVPYTIEGVNPDGSLTGEWEVGVGTYSGANTLTRTTVLSSSNAGAAVNFSAGTKQVWIDLPAALVVPRLATGEVGLRAAPATDAALTVGAPSGAGATLHGANYDLTAPATASALYGIKSALRTAAAAFTLGLAAHFSANAASLGASSAITEVRGFEARTAAAVGGTNRAFYTDFTAANGYAFYGAGTAMSYFGGPVGILSTGVAPSDGILLRLGAGNAHPGTPVTLYNVYSYTVAPSTATGAFYGFSSALGTAAASFTLTTATHFFAGGIIKGAGSTVTSGYGFHADNSLATANNNYGFYSNINAAANTYQLYMVGTAPSYFGGRLGVGTIPAAAYMLQVSPLASVVTTGSAYGFGVTGTSPSTATTTYGAVNLQVTGSAAHSNLFGIYISTMSVGAGSATTMAGIRVDDFGGATGNYAFYSAMAASSSKWAFYAAGTAASYFGGIVQMQSSGTSANLQVGNFTPAVADSAAVLQNTVAGTSTTSRLAGYHSVLATTNAAFALNLAIHFAAINTTRGAASTLTNSIGFYAYNGIANGTNNYGFYSDIANASSTYQLYMAGSASSYLAGSVGIGVLASNTDNSFQVWATSTISGTTARGVLVRFIAPATSTSTATGIEADMQTVGSAFTVNSLNAFHASNVTLGAGSTITSYYGFRVNNNVVGKATNTYGFYSDMNTASGVWALYMQGTALSYFSAAVHFGGATAAVSDATARIHLNGATSNMLAWNTNGTSAPTATSRSAGTKAVLYPGVSASSLDYAIGIESGAMWFSTGSDFKWYVYSGSVLNTMSLTSGGALNVTGAYQVDGAQVVSNRITGWAAATGTKARTTFITDSATTAAVAARLGQLIDDLMTHGLIGA